MAITTCPNCGEEREEIRKCPICHHEEFEVRTVDFVRKDDMVYDPECNFKCAVKREQKTTFCIHLYEIKQGQITCDRPRELPDELDDV